MKTYDAIVVGAGHNGLTTAAFLAKAGLDVVCVEKNDYIGGAAVSRNLYEDYRQYMGEPPARIVKVWLIANSLFQRGEGGCDYADIIVSSDAETLQVL